MLRFMMVVLAFVSLRASAQTPQVIQPESQETADREPAQAPTAPHMYLGARDEQKLEVQGSLPQPSRSLEGGVNLSSDDDDAPPATAPASD